QHFPTIMVVDTGRYEIHPIYLSMHCSVAGLFSLYVFKGIEKNWAKVLLGLVNVVLLLFLLLYAKKGPLLALMLVSFLFIGFQRKSKWVKPYIFGLIALAVLLVAIPKTRNNFFELFSIETIEGGNITSTNIRYTIYNTAIAKIAEKPFTGYGIGDHNQALYDGYREAGNTYLLENELNAHNQYLSLLLIGGLFLLLALFFTLGMNLVYAVRYNNQILILLIIFYSVVMFTENILEREDGVIYFALFLNFFARLSYEQPKKDGAAGHQKTPIEPYPA
ncbi:MAG: O-antigen ligase family protein, partial [Marinirhabdus sp.]